MKVCLVELRKNVLPLARTIEHLKSELSNLKPTRLEQCIHSLAVGRMLF